MYYSLKEYEDLIELDMQLDCEINLDSLRWIQYNPRKDIRRWGCSITSLNGHDNGVPDLDSLLEFNSINKTNFNEMDFRTRTKHANPFHSFLKNFTCGRSHFLKLEPGGFFPWHRDNDLKTFRILYTIQNCFDTNLVWLEDDELLKLKDKTWYYINTKKKHCLFAFEQATMAVFNVEYSQSNITKLYNSFKIK